MANLKAILVYVPPQLLAEVDQCLAQTSEFTSRSHLIRRLLENWKSERETGNVENTS